MSASRTTADHAPVERLTEPWGFITHPDGSVTFYGADGTADQGPLTFGDPERARLFAAFRDHDPADPAPHPLSSHYDAAAAYVAHVKTAGEQAQRALLSRIGHAEASAHIPARDLDEAVTVAVAQLVTECGWDGESVEAVLDRLKPASGL